MKTFSLLKSVHIVCIVTSCFIFSSSVAYSQCGIDIRGKKIISLPKPRAKIKCLQINNSSIPGTLKNNKKTFNALTCEANRLKKQYARARNKFKQRTLARSLKKLQATINSANYVCGRISGNSPKSNSTPTPAPPQEIKPDHYSCFASGSTVECSWSYGPGLKFPICIRFPAIGFGKGKTLEEAKNAALEDCLDTKGETECYISNCF